MCSAMHKSIKNKVDNLAAFTLVEFAISILIIGLLIAGLTAGAGLIKSAKIRNVIAEYGQYKTAILAFKEQYHAVPGDIPNASSYWTGATSGNGNGYIDAMTDMTEAVLVWRHLRLAGLISGSYT